MRCQNASVALALALALAACSSGRDREVKAKDLERIAQKQLSRNGKRSPRVYCGAALDAHVGATTTCWMWIERAPHDVTMTVTEVDGSNVAFDIEVAAEPQGFDAGAGDD